MTTSLDRRALERLGAQARITSLEGELVAIRRAFPGLGRPQKATASNGATPRRRRSRMSAAARKAVSTRMKKYWAERRKAKS
jgi:hypothetical protein